MADRHEWYELLTVININAEAISGSEQALIYITADKHREVIE